jgi:hypothetical protein
MQAQQLAVTMATDAKSTIHSSPQFATWFGTGSKSDVEANYQGLMNLLNTGTFLYDLTKMTNSQISNDMFFCYSNDSTATSKVVIPWLGMFSQPDLSVVKMAALSLIQLCIQSDTIFDLDIASDQDGAKFLAQYDPGRAVKSPRNYRYFAEFCQ